MTNFTNSDPSRVLIIDISKWQDDPTNQILPDFQKMKSLGVRGVIVKCGEGNGIDRAFSSYIHALNLSGLPYGAYWYYNNKYSPVSQARLFSDTVRGHTFKLGLWLDLEDRNPGLYKGWKYWYDFIVTLRADYAGKLGIYTGYYYFVEHTPPTIISKASLEWFSQFPLWIAAYSTSIPMIPRPWASETFWQFTDFLDGINYGVESRELDGNYYNGTLDEFNQFFGTSAIEEPPQELKVTQYQMTTMNVGTRIRSDHNTYASVLDSVPLARVVVTGNELWVAPADGNEVKSGDKWLKVSYNNVTGWMAYIHKGVPICDTFKEIPSLPVEPAPLEDVDVHVNITDGVLTVSVNNEEWEKKQAV